MPHQSVPSAAPGSRRPIRPTDGLFRCDVVHERARVRIALSGELDIASAPQLDQTLRTFLYTGFGRVVIDLRRLSFIDSTGLHLILRYAEAARRAELRFGLIPGPPAVQRIFELTGTNVLFDFEPAAPPSRTFQRRGGAADGRRRS
jgi:anti-anti-sigma factor